MVTLHVNVGWLFEAIPDVAGRVWKLGQRNAKVNVGWGLLTFESGPVWEGVGGRRRIKVDNSALNIEFKQSYESFIKDSFFINPGLRQIFHLLIHYH